MCPNLRCTLIALVLLAIFGLQTGADVHGNSISFTHLQPNSSESVLLSDLISGEVPGLVVGDKLFDGFTYQFTGDMPTGSLINVSGIEVEGHFGIRFQGGFKDLFDLGNQSSNSLIEFDVHVADPKQYLISDVHLDGNPSLSQPADSVLNAFAAVVETVSGPFGSLELRIQSDLNGLTNTAWIDPLPWPVERLHVSKDIQLFSIIENEIGTRATISRIDQTFSQIQVEIPEPTTLCLFGFAVICSVCSRRREQT